MRRLLFSALRQPIKIVAIILCAIILGQLPAARALDSQNKSIAIGINPAVIEVAARPGQTVKRELTVSNQTNFSLPVATQVQSLLDTDEIINQKIKSQFDGASWVAVTPDSFVMAKNQVKQLPITISVPKNATPGGHYAQISVRGLTLEGGNITDGNTSIVVPEITVSVLITVGGYINERLAFSPGSIFSLFTVPGKEKIISFSVENRGNVHALIVPQIIVDKNGKEISRSSLTPKIILPNSVKEFQESWQVPRNSGLYSARVEFSYGTPIQAASSPAERIVLMPPLWELLTAALIAFLAHYLIRHRKNLKAAWTVLLGHK